MEVSSLVSSQAGAVPVQKELGAGRALRWVGGICGGRGKRTTEQPRHDHCPCPRCSRCPR